ncbi:MAG: T9SS type A sorting domain-containing protein [Crocinitomicaceae bacterium]
MIVLIGGRSYTLKVWTSQPNGVTDSNPSNDTIITVVNAVNTLPDKRVLFEKFSHTTCGPCYSAGFDFDQMLNDHPFATGVSIQSASSDPYSTPEGDEVDNLYTFAHPEFIADRKKLIGNSGFGIDEYQGVTEDLNKAAEELEAVAVSISNFSLNNLTNTIQFDVVADFYGDYVGDLGINAYIIEDSIFGYQAGSPTPNSYYHMHILRSMLGGAWGAPFQMSDVINGIYSKTFQYVIPTDQNPEHISVIGFVQRINTNIDQRHILNCTPEVSLSEAGYLSILENDDFKRFKIFPNPANGIVHLVSAKDLEGAVRVAIYDIAGKEVFNNLYNSVSESQMLDLSILPKGTYFFLASNKSGEIIDQQLIVLK